MRPAPAELLRLADGRDLAYARWGAAAGPALIVCHGWPGSRLVGALLDAAARKRGVRLISVDRPGIGRSTFQPGRTLLDWPTDVAALADALALRRFAVVGLSGGGPFALACAHRLARRLSGVALVASMGPLATRADRAVLPLQARVMLRAARRVPRLNELAVAALAAGAVRLPGLLSLAVRTAAPAVDRALMEQPALAASLRAELEEALAQGPRGLAQEVAIFSRPWGFALEALPAPVVLFQGEADANVPPKMGRRLAARLPRCAARFIPGAGHLWYVRGFGEVLEALQLDGAPGGAS